MTANPTRVHDNLTRRERQSQRADIVIKPADKGSGTVVMNRQNYLDECYRQLNDLSFYKRVNSLSIRRFWGKRGKMEAKKGES